LPHLLNRFWKMPTISIFDQFRGRAQISGAGVITEPLPGMKNVVLGSVSQRGEIREPVEPLIIIREHCGDLGLLKHELGNQDGVWIARPSPGKVAAVFAIPAQESPVKCVGISNCVHDVWEKPNGISILSCRTESRHLSLFPAQVRDSSTSLGMTTR
jgi:hypothetical protein